MKNYHFNKYITIALILIAIAWCSFIFFNSSKNVTQSGLDSRAIVKIIVGDEIYNNPESIITLPFGEKIRSKVLVGRINSLIRNLAHFFEYYVLAIIALLFLNTKNINKTQMVIITLILVLSLAITDEVYQNFTGRDMSLDDVITDFFGGIFGCTTFISIKLFTQRFALEFD